MALSITPLKVYSIGDRKEVIFEVAFDDSYTEGGEPLTAEDLGLELELNYVESGVAEDGTGNAVLTVYNYDDETLMAYTVDTTIVEVSDEADLDGYTVRLRAVGKGSAVA